MTGFARRRYFPFRMNARRWLLVALSFVATIGVSLYIVLTSWPAQRAPVALPISAHLLALLVVAIEIAARAGKISLSARALGFRLSLGTSARTILGGDFGAAITPARSGAEPARYLIVAEAGLAPPNILMLLFAELFLEVISLLLVGGALALIVHGSRAMLGGVFGLVGGYAAVVAAAGAGAWVLSRRPAADAPPAWLTRLGLGEAAWQRVRRSLLHLRESVSSLRHARVDILAGALTLSVLHVVARLAVLPVLVYAFPDPAPLAPLVAWPFALFYGGVVSPVPGGGGLIEVAFRALLGGAMAPRIFGAALIWWRFYTFYLYIILGALAAGRTVMRAIRPAARSGARDLGAPSGVSALAATPPVVPPPARVR